MEFIFFFHTLLNVKTKKQSVPLFLLIFVLEELFELLGVLHVRAAVRLWLKHTQPGPSADLQTHTHTHALNQKNSFAAQAVTKEASV